MDVLEGAREDVDKGKDVIAHYVGRDGVIDYRLRFYWSLGRVVNIGRMKDRQGVENNETL